MNIMAEIPDCIKKFLELEESLQGQKGLYGEWVRFAYETFEAYEVTPLEFTHMICGSFRQVKDQYSIDIARNLYGIIIDGALLPDEILRAAEYLHNGGRIEDVPEMAHNGLFEPQMSMDSPS